MQDREELPHPDGRTAAAAFGGRGELLPDGAPIILGQEESDVGASLQLKDNYRFRIL